MKKIEVRYKSEYSDAPDELVLDATKKDYDELCIEIKQYEELIKIRPFSVTIDKQIYFLPEESDYRPEMEMLQVYPNANKHYMDWNIVQRMQHKHDSSDYLETREFTLKELLPYFYKLIL